MKYILIEFTKGLSGQAYQVIDEGMNCVGYVSTIGEPINTTDVVFESKVIDPEMKEITF